MDNPEPAIVASQSAGRGPAGQVYLVSGKSLSMRLWRDEAPGEPRAATTREYETVGYVCVERQSSTWPDRCYRSRRVIHGWCRAVHLIRTELLKRFRQSKRRRRPHRIPGMCRNFGHHGRPFPGAKTRGSFTKRRARTHEQATQCRPLERLMTISFRRRIIISCNVRACHPKYRRARPQTSFTANLIR